MKTITATFLFIAGLLLTNAAFANQIWGGQLVIAATDFVEMNDKNVLILDARAKKKYDKKHPKNAISVWWADYSKTEKSERGDLLAFGEIAKKLGALGISSDQPIIVVDDAIKGWGESGRIAWMLRELGHDKVAIIDGGVQALEELRFPMEKKIAKRTPVIFQVQKSKTWAMLANDIQQAAENKTAVIDTREKREYKGWTPYGESRGGHVPGAKHVFYRDLVDKKGRLKAKDVVVGMLSKRGISKTTKISAYCTGGIRSAWMVIVLRHFGYDAYNYAGSMWQWSARDKAGYPLVKNLNPFSD